MIINNESEIANKNNNIEYISLNPRTETIVELPILDKSIENKNIILHKQEFIKDVYCSNVIGTVKNGKIVVSILNISEDKQIIKLNDLNKIEYDESSEYNIYINLTLIMKTVIITTGYFV
jgi:hypothetical protein